VRSIRYIKGYKLTHLVLEDLINMGVDGNTLPLRIWHKVIPVGQRPECIMHEEQCVALLAVAKGVP
jgi:hypothetical protein